MVQAVVSIAEAILWGFKHIQMHYIGIKGEVSIAEAILWGFKHD